MAASLAAALRLQLRSTAIDGEEIEALTLAGSPRSIIPLEFGTSLEEVYARLLSTFAYSARRATLSTATPQRSAQQLLSATLPPLATILSREDLPISPSADPDTTIWLLGRAGSGIRALRRSDIDDSDIIVCVESEGRDECPGHDAEAGPCEPGFLRSLILHAGTVLSSHLPAPSALTKSSRAARIVPLGVFLKPGRISKLSPPPDPNFRAWAEAVVPVLEGAVLSLASCLSSVFAAREAAAAGGAPAQLQVPGKWAPPGPPPSWTGCLAYNHAQQCRITCTSSHASGL